MGYKLDNTKLHLMPVGFGPMFRGNKGIEVDEKTGKIEVDQFVHAINHILVYESNPIQLEKLMPEEIALDKPYVIVTHRTNRNYRGHAGKNYSLLQVTIPVRFDGQEDSLKGSFMPVIWENHGDPCVVGRELLGYCKIYADIEEVTGLGGVLKACASSWGYQFVDIRYNMKERNENIDELRSIINDPDNAGEINYAYLQRVGSLTELDRDYFTLLEKGQELDYPDNLGDVPAPAEEYGTGSIRWIRPEYDDMPYWYHIVQGLEELEIKRVVGTVKKVYYHLANARVRIIK